MGGGGLLSFSCCLRCLGWCYRRVPALLWLPATVTAAATAAAGFKSGWIASTLSYHPLHALSADEGSGGGGV